MAFMIFKLQLICWFKGVGIQFRLGSSFLLGTGLTGLGHRSDRLIYVKPMQILADRSDRSGAPV